MTIQNIKTALDKLYATPFEQQRPGYLVVPGQKLYDLIDAIAATPLPPVNSPDLGATDPAPKYGTVAYEAAEARDSVTRNDAAAARAAAKRAQTLADRCPHPIERLAQSFSAE